MAIGLGALHTLEAIHPPSSDTAAYRALLATVRSRGRRLGELLVAAYSSGQHARVGQLLDQVLALERRADAQAAALGMQVCATPVPTG